MSDTIIAAFIGGAATIVAALIGLFAVILARKKDERRARAESLRGSRGPGGLPLAILCAARKGILREPFSIASIARAIPASLGHSHNYMNVVLANNSLGGNYGTDYFERVAEGQYRVVERWRETPLDCP